MTSDKNTFPSIEQQGFSTVGISHCATVDYSERNGSIEKLAEDKYVLAFGKSPKEYYKTYLHVLDDELKILETVGPLPLPFRGSGIEDTRLIQHDGLTYCAYTDVALPHADVEINFTQSLSVLSPDFTVLRNIPLDYRGNFSGQWEKNWGFFFWNDRLHFVYSIRDHVVVELDFNGNIQNEYVMNKKLPDHYDDFNMHTGTPPKPLDDDHYIAFFHSWNKTGSWNVPERVYRVSAYTFEARPPFSILKMTQPLIYGSRLNALSDHPAVLFPAGLIVDQEQFLISIGINDVETKIVQIEKEYVIDQLVWI